MTNPIEDYAFISDGQSAALISKAGSIDWLCFPRFDSLACFAALLGTPDNGHWVLAPVSDYRSERRYIPGTLVLETVHRAHGGSVAVIDTLVASDGKHRLVRLVEGRSGSVRMRMRLVIRFDYGSIVPWVRTDGTSTFAVGGPDALVLSTPMSRHGEDLTTIAEFTIREGERVPFDLAWHQSTDDPPPPIDVRAMIYETLAWWRGWSRDIKYRGAYQDEVHDSLVVLRGLVHRVTGAITAAPTTSLPEWLGSSRNWDYRYCWLRDATFTLLAFLRAGCLEEASAWRDWLVRAIAGDPAKVQIMYGLGGERRLTETELPWLAGYAGSSPVRVGNGAAGQL